MLPPMHPDEGDQLPKHMYLSSTKEATQGRADYPVRELRLQGMR